MHWREKGHPPALSYCNYLKYSIILGNYGSALFDGDANLESQYSGHDATLDAFLSSVVDASSHSILRAPTWYAN